MSFILFGRRKRIFSEDWDVLALTVGLHGLQLLEQPKNGLLMFGCHLKMQYSNLFSQESQPQTQLQ
jgi:hypothetical protein